MEGVLRSELEYLILGMVAAGLQSGYAIRLHMNRIEGIRWSSESGSVYRVLRRLQEAGLLKMTGKAGVPNRERTEYAATDKGLDALREWIKSDLRGEELSLLVDPVRIRVRYFDQLPVEQRLEAVKRWIAQNAAYIRKLRRRFRHAATTVDIADSNLLALAKARQAWLKGVAASLTDR